MNVSQLKLDTHFLAGSTSATYSDTALVRNMNIAYQDVARLIWDVADGWQYDDTNATTLPIAKATLVNNQQDYSLPSTAQRVHRVQVKDSSGNWHLLKQRDLHDISIAVEEFTESPGLPVYYDILGRSVMLYPTPSSVYVTLSAGLEVFVDRDITELAVTATTYEPGFAAPFHRILSYAAALDFVQDEQQRRFLAQQKQRLEQGLTTFYARRNVARNASIRPGLRPLWRKYK